MDAPTVFGMLGLGAIAFLAGALAVRPPLPPVAPWLYAWLGAAALWTGGELLATQAETLAAKRVGLGVLYTGSLLQPAVWLVAAVRWVRLYAPDHAPHGKAWERVPLALFAALWLAMATGPWHGGFLEPVVGGRNLYGPGFYAALAVGYAEIGLAAALCLRLSRVHVDAEVRHASGLLALASLVPLAANALYVFWGGYASSALTGFVLAGSGAAAVYAVWRARALWLLPVALSEIVRRDRCGVILLGRGGQPVYVNPAAEKLLEGMPLGPGEPLAPRLGRRLGREDGSPLEGALLGDLTEAGPSGRVYRDTARDGAWLRVSLHELGDRRHRTRATALRVEDARESVRAEGARRELARRLLEAEQLHSVARLAGGVAHGFNDALRAILGNASLARTRLGPDSPHEGTLREIERACHRAAALSHQVLAFAGGTSPGLEPVDLGALAAEVAAERAEAVPEGVVLETDLPAALPAVPGDAGQLRRVLEALVDGALARLGPGPGRVTLRAGRLDPASGGARAGAPAPGPGAWLRLEVTDSAGPLPEDERRRVLEPFEPARDLDLAAASGLVRAHGGVLGVESGPAGSAFRVLLPLGAVFANGNGRGDDAEEWRGEGLVLVVDEQPAVREVAATMLRRLGFAVVAAAGARDALERAGDTPGLRLAILGLGPRDPGVDETVTALRRLHPRLPLVLSGAPTPTDPPADPASPTVFLPKPYGLASMRRAVRRALAAA